ncbi:alpha/beta-hydrolase [Neoconidiobolus thromboides FSU 785]|nr:alpha/beta-hydrolase [Neoconidiobolus thromboides FSU 785]
MIDWTFGLSAVLATSLGLIYRGQQFLLYMPSYPQDSRTKIESPSKYGMEDYEDLRLTCEDDTKIQAYMIYSDIIDGHQSNLTILYFHANAGNLGHRLPIASRLHTMLNCNILMVSYRGYGKSEGEPEEEGIKLDSQAALDYILNNDRLKDNKIIVYGQSIGGAVAIALAEKNKRRIDGIIIENTFLSLSKLVETLVPIGGSIVSYLLNQTWDSESSIINLKHLPILFLVGEKDQLINPTHMEKLFELASVDSTCAKSFVVIKDGTHNDTCIFPTYYRAIKEFITRNRLI